MSTAPGTLRTPQQVADRRAGSPHTSMFWRMLLRAAALRRGRAASALLAMVVAAAVATAMMNLYVDVQAKLRTEFRNYGANVVVVAKNGKSLPADAVSTIEASTWAEDPGSAVRIRCCPHPRMANPWWLSELTLRARANSTAGGM